MGIFATEILVFQNLFGRRRLNKFYTIHFMNFDSWVQFSNYNFIKHLSLRNIFNNIEGLIIPLVFN